MSAAGVYELITFRLGEELFAVQIGAVERVLRYQRPTALPNLPEWIDGVVEYGQRVVPVFDLRRRVGLTTGEPRMETRVIIFQLGADWVGGVVDAVLEVLTVEASQVAEPPAVFRGLPAAYLRGLVRRGERLLILFDLDRLLTSTERLELQQATAQEVGHG